MTADLLTLVPSAATSTAARADLMAAIRDATGCDPRAAFGAAAKLRTGARAVVPCPTWNPSRSSGGLHAYGINTLHTPAPGVPPMNGLPLDPPAHPRQPVVTPPIVSRDEPEPTPAGAEADLAAALRRIMGAQPMDEARVVALIEQHAPKPTGLTITIKREAEAGEIAHAIELGPQHRNFPRLLRACQARDKDGNRLNIWLPGGAGSGKTTAARAVGRALGLEVSQTGCLSTAYELLGFVDGRGTYQRTQLRERWEHGGIFIFDELDQSEARAVNAFMGALADGFAAFPDGKTIRRHPDCIIIACCNTWGSGSTGEYVGTARMNAAFVDRFAPIAWPVDEDLESALSPLADWTALVQRVRAAVVRRGIKHLITPRATFIGAALLAAGETRANAIESLLRRSIPAATWAEIASESGI